MMLTEKFLPYARQALREEDGAEMTKVLLTSFITRGPKVQEFEQALSTYCGAQFAVAFNSGTSALEAACYAANVTQHDRLISSPNTFIGTIGGGMHYHANPVFVDIDGKTGNLNIEEAEAALDQPSSRGRPILLPVHFAGLPVDMEKLERKVKNPDAVIIEDAAQALGSCYPDGQRVGCCAWSHMTVFSFHPAKLVTTGEGGAVLTNDAELCHRLRLFRNNGIERDPAYMQKQEGPWYYEVHDATGNFNFTDFQAALGLCQLNRIDQMIAERQQIMVWYRERLRGFPQLRLLSEQDDVKVAHQLCVVRINFAAARTNRSKVIEQLLSEGIGTQVHYIPLYRHPLFSKQCGDISSYFPEMERYYAETLSLPLYNGLTEEDVDRITVVLKRALGIRK